MFIYFLHLNEFTVKFQKKRTLISYICIHSSVENNKDENFHHTMDSGVESSEMRDAVDKLEKARTKILEVKGWQVSQLQWTLRFRDSGGEDSSEHEAFC